MAATAGPRFLLEASFLAVLAVVLGFSDLSLLLIILVMALAWVLVSLIEYFAWRQGPRFPPRFAPLSGSAPVYQEERESSEPGLPPAAPQPEEETAAAPPPEALAPAGDTGADEPGNEPQLEAEQRAPHSLEPLQPRPRRRWIFFGRGERQREEPGSRDEES